MIPNTRVTLRPDYIGYPEVVLTLTTLGPLGLDYFYGSPGDRAPEHRDHARGKEGGDKIGTLTLNLV